MYTFHKLVGRDILSDTLSGTLLKKPFSACKHSSLYLLPDTHKRCCAALFLGLLLFCVTLVAAPVSASASTLQEIRDRGYLRHAGAEHPPFIITEGHGFDVEIMQRFAQYLGVAYKYVPSHWQRIFSDVSGVAFTMRDFKITRTGTAPVKADIGSCGIVMTPWREEIVRFTKPMFSTQVWALTWSKSPLQPITPVNLDQDIAATRALLKGKHVAGYVDSYLDPRYHNIPDIIPNPLAHGSINEYYNVLFSETHHILLLNAISATHALSQWAGRIKILGPIAKPQAMAPVVAKEATELEAAFAVFSEQIQKDGTLEKLKKKYNLGQYEKNLPNALNINGSSYEQ